MAEQGDKNDQISDNDDGKKLDALADMIRDACSKMDEGVKRLDARMDAMDSRMDSLRKDADEDEKREDARKDADEDKDEKRDDSDEEEERKDADEDKDEKRDDSDEEEERKDADEDKDEKREDARKDADEDEEEKVADHAPISRREAEELRRTIAQLQARTPAILSDADRDRFAAIQEQAEPAFQAFGDRAPAPLQGETPTQYKRRLGSKLQGNSPKWKDARLSAVSDEVMLDAVLDDIYADSIASARSGAAVPAGQLRARERSSGGHTIIEYEGGPEAWMNNFAGNSQRATGGWLRPN